MKEKLERFKELVQEKKKIEATLTLLYWDLETCAPKQGKAYLAEVIGYMSMKEYEITTSKEFVDLVLELNEKRNELDEITKKEIELLSEEIEKMKKIPPHEYQEYSELLGRSQGAWEEAKKTNNYELFKENLRKIVEFTIKFANYHRKDEKTLYDVVLNEYEKGITTEKLDSFFDALKKEIIPLLEKIKAKKQVERKLNFIVPIENQKRYCRYLSEYLGFDFNRGVLKESEHPFTTNVDKNDVRLTSKYIDNMAFSAVFSTIHETGHGIYEQQIKNELVGTILGGGGSMALHESQSRFYENMVGRSIHFWKGIYKKSVDFIPELKNISLDDFYKEINIVEPSLIRTEADELTYCLHIMVRYEIEKELIEGKISVDELPTLWKEKMLKYVGVAPETDTEGVLQDVHWSGGSLGYFPSYALGSVYAAQIYHYMRKDFNIEETLENNNLEKIREWLGKNIHSYGKLKDTNEIIKSVCGEDLNPKYFIEYLKEKYTKLYNL